MDGKLSSTAVHQYIIYIYIYIYQIISQYVSISISSINNIILGHQDFGDVNSNGLGHRVTTTVDPLTQKKCQAIFIPKLKPGYWQGSISNDQQIEDSSILDDDVDALRPDQLHFGCIQVGQLVSQNQHHNRSIDYYETMTMTIYYYYYINY